MSETRPRILVMVEKHRRGDLSELTQELISRGMDNVSKMKNLGVIEGNIDQTQIEEIRQLSWVVAVKVEDIIDFLKSKTVMKT